MLVGVGVESCLQFFALIIAGRARVGSDALASLVRLPDGVIQEIPEPREGVIPLGEDDDALP